MARTAEQMAFERRLREAERLVRKLPEVMKPLDVRLTDETADPKLRRAGLLVDAQGGVRFTLKLDELTPPEPLALADPKDG